MKRILVTAWAVYGALDANKIVSNRIRGLWATRFARWLAERGHPVTLLIPDTMPGTTAEILSGLDPSASLTVLQHRGYSDYASKCEKLALEHDAAVMAAAVVNWIPAEPYPGKMPTEGYNEGDIINVPFVLAPRVINRMRVINPKLTLIGCKMLVGASEEALIDAAYHVSLAAKCNVVVANDMGHGLRTKKLVYPDRTVVTYEDDFDGFFKALHEVILDEHWHSEEVPGHNEFILKSPWNARALHTFDRVVEKYRDRFSPRGDGKVFGSLLVPTEQEGYLTSPREKGTMFSSKDAVWVPKILPDTRTVVIGRGAKATMNAPLLIRMAMEHAVMTPRGGLAQPPVLHLHEHLEGAPTVPYGPPGTDRDNLRVLPEGVKAFNIEGHGFIACLDPDTLEISA